VKFLADECCPASIVSALREAGHDVNYVIEISPEISDLEAAALAQAQRRVLVTEDYDFGELAVRHHVRMPGLVILALLDQPRDFRVRRMLETVARFADDLYGQITVVELNRERVRPLVAG
jgi:predicted nuclease of predicted toxin-antitoxin system